MDTQSAGGTGTLWGARAALTLAVGRLWRGRRSGAGATALWRGKAVRYPAGLAVSGGRGYPDLRSLRLALPAGRAFALALATARSQQGWEITGTDSATGRIEATATTSWFGFKDDI